VAFAAGFAARGLCLLTSELNSRRKLVRPRYTCVPNCAWRSGTGRVGRCPGARKRRESRIRKSHPEVPAGARRYEEDARIENGSPDLHRQVDTQGFVFAKTEALSHGQLRRHIGIVSQHMLTRTLRNLESTGVITRRVTRSKAIAVEYSLTQLGRTLIAPLGSMCRWSKRHPRPVSADVRLPERHQAQ